MVRETRHLWVGNLPENIREDRIRDHFKRYGRVQSVKLLGGRGDKDEVCATVSFMDIKSAAKAHHSEQKLDERLLTTEYHEPAAIPTPNYSRFHLGSEEVSSSFDRSSHFYERGEGAGGYIRRSGYHSGSESLSRNRIRTYRNGPYTSPVIIESVVSRSGSHHTSSSRSGGGGSWPYENPSPRYPPSTPDISYPEPANILVHKKHSKSRSGSDSGSNSSRSRSSSASSQSGSSTCSTASSSPVSDKSCSTHSQQSTLRSSGVQSSGQTNHNSSGSPAVHSEDRRPLAICVRNLPARSSDTSLKDGLYHEYKKHGKVTWVKVVGQGVDRYALVSFKKPEDVDKALQVSHDKLFFGCKIEVAPYQGYDVDDNEFRPFEAEQDEFHPKATRTLFIGNLDKDITAQEIRKHFDQFGEIIDIDIKKQGTSTSYAFCQFSDIGSVVRAMRSLDGEHVGGNRVKLGFGKSMHTNVVWVDGVAESVSEKYLSQQFGQFGPVTLLVIDRARGQALVSYEQVSYAQQAVKEMRGAVVRGRKLQVDYASRECQESFYDHMEKQSATSTHPPFENSNSVASSPQNLRVFESPSSSSTAPCTGSGSTVSSRYNSCTRYSSTRTNNGNTTFGRSSSPTSRSSRHSTSRFQEYPSTACSGQEYERRSSYRSYEDISQAEENSTPAQGSGDIIRHLQKERVSLLEQLEDCTSSGEEGTNRRRCNKHRRSASGEGSRPGTPLCDERPENLGPVEPRRPRESRPPDPLSLPLPRFASQVLSPRPIPPSPPASPLTHSSSSDSEPSPEWEERLKSLDEKYEKWSTGSRAGISKIDPSTVKVRHKLLDLDLHELQPSDIVKSVLAKRSVFDEDSKRLENFGEKYEPREFIPARSSLLRGGRLDLSPMSSPVVKSPSSPAAKGLQYPFPSHPPVQPTTSVATTTPPSSATVTVATTEIKSSPTTFLTNCTTARQFPLPKISSPQAEKCDASPRAICTKVMPMPTTVAKPLVPSKPVQELKKEPNPIQAKVKSNTPLRRESCDEKKEEGRRKSRDESVESVKSIENAGIKRDDTSECDKVKDAQVTERRKSVSEKRRCSSDIKDTCERIKDPSVEKRRGSSETESETSKKSEKKLFDENHMDIPKPVSEIEKIRKVPNDSTERRKENESNVRHNIDIDKKKDVLGVNSEKDRRRNRESSESSDNPKNKKVPENKKELDTVDKRDKDDDSCISRIVDTDKKKEPSDTCSAHHLNRHKEKKDHQDRRRDSLEHSDKKLDRISPENPEVHRIKEKKTNHDLTEPRNSKKHHDDSDMKGENVKHKDSERRKNSEHEISKEHSLFKKVFGFAERTYGHHKDRRDSDSTAVKTDETIKHKRDHSDRKKEKDSDHSESSSKHRSRKSPDQPENNRHKERKHSESSEKRSRKEYEQHSDELKQKDDHPDNFHSKPRDKKEERSKECGKNSNSYSVEEEFVPTLGKHRDNERRKEVSLDESRNSETDSSDLKQKDGECKKDNEAFFERRKEDNSENRNKDERRKDSEKYFDCEKYNNDRIKKDDEAYKDVDKKSDSSSDFVKFKHDRHNERKREVIVENCRTKDQKDDHRQDVSKNKEERSKTDEIFDSLKSKDDNFRYRDFLKKKDSESQDHIRIKDIIDSKKKEEKEKKKERDSQEIFKKSRDPEERNRESEKLKRKKEFETNETKMNGDHDDYIDNIEIRKPNYEEDIRIDPIKKEKRKDRNNIWPATIGCKRRISSQDSLDIVDEAKRSKPERRDSKDSGRSSGSSRKGSSEKHKGFNKLLEEKIKEDKEHEHRKKEDLLLESNEKNDDKLLKPAIRKEKRNSGEKRKEERKFKNRPRENGTASESDMASGDEEINKVNKRQHSIFDIVDDEPAYISMYDKVKARSTKNMQKQEEEKRQEKLKEKFHQLKASRAKREEKKRSTSYDEDSDSEKGSSRRSNKLLITSSEDDACSESDIRIRSRKILCDTSEDDSIAITTNVNKYSEYENKSSRKIISDVSEDDTVIKHSTPKLKSRNISFESDLKIRKIMSDTSEDDSARINITRQKPSRIQSDDSEGDLGFEDSVKSESVVPIKPAFLEPTVKITDVFANRPVEMNHFASPDLDKQHALQSSPESLRRISLDSATSEQPRKKSHKKKQKKKNYEVSEDGTIIVRKHSSKKEKKKSHRDNEDEEKKSRKKKNERESSSNKREDKFEDIFGPLSDDSEKAALNKWHVSQVYGSDSESERENIRKKEKKRREKKLRELDEAGRALEAKLLDTSEDIIEEPVKTKKKKRKKSRDEKIKHHRILDEDSSPPILSKEHDSISQVKQADTEEVNDSEREVRLETDNEREEEEDEDDDCKMVIDYNDEICKEETPSVVRQHSSSLSSLLDSPPSQPVQHKKPDIPGFGSEVDENIHETAVKSISETSREEQTTIPQEKYEEKSKTEEQPPPEEKPAPVISQEETEDAVAALLMEETFGAGFERYSEETPKPDTPASEPDLQIDTDTEDTFDQVEFSKTPRESDGSGSFYEQNDTREGLEERIMPLACSAEPVVNKESETSSETLVIPDYKELIPTPSPSLKKEEDLDVSVQSSSLSSDVEIISPEIKVNKEDIKEDFDAERASLLPMPLKIKEENLDSSNEDISDETKPDISMEEDDIKLEIEDVKPPIANVNIKPEITAIDVKKELKSEFKDDLQEVCKEVKKIECEVVPHKMIIDLIPAPIAVKPSVLKCPVPTPAILKPEMPLPLKSETPLPLKSETSLPLKSDTPLPLKSETSLPLKSETPLPLKSETPLPSESETPLPSESETLLPLKSETPLLLKSETPLPLKSETPLLLKSETPLPLKSETPLPLKSETPLALKSETPLPLKSEGSSEPEVLSPQVETIKQNVIQSVQSDKVEPESPGSISAINSQNIPKTEKTVLQQALPVSHSTVLVHQPTQQPQTAQVVKPLTIQVLNQPPALKPLEQPIGPKSNPGPPVSIKLASPPALVTTSSQASSFQQKSPQTTSQSTVQKSTLHHVTSFQGMKRQNPIPHLVPPHIPVKPATQISLQTPQLTPISKGNLLASSRPPLVVHTIHGPPSQKQLHVVTPSSQLSPQPPSPQNLKVIRPVQNPTVNIRTPLSPQTATRPSSSSNPGVPLLQTASANEQPINKFPIRPPISLGSSNQTPHEEKVVNLSPSMPVQNSTVSLTQKQTVLSSTETNKPSFVKENNIDSPSVIHDVEKKRLISNEKDAEKIVPQAQPTQSLTKHVEKMVPVPPVQTTPSLSKHVEKILPPVNPTQSLPKNLEKIVPPVQSPQSLTKHLEKTVPPIQPAPLARYVEKTVPQVQPTQSLPKHEEKTVPPVQPTQAVSKHEEKAVPPIQPAQSLSKPPVIHITIDDSSSDSTVVTAKDDDEIQITVFEPKLIKPNLEEPKPLNIVIQDLKMRAANKALSKPANNSNTSVSEITKSDSPKPIEQVVRELQLRKKAASQSTDAEKVTTLPTTENKEEVENIKDAKAESISSQEEKKEVPEMPKTTTPVIEDKITEEPSKIKGDSKLEDVKIDDFPDKKGEAETSTKDHVSTPKDLESTPPSTDKNDNKPQPIHIPDTPQPRTPKASKDSQPEMPSSEERVTTEKTTTPLVVSSGRGRGGRTRGKRGRGAGIATRRGGRHATTSISHTTPARTQPAPADVYEFRDDSEEERPRLILTIKPEQTVPQSNPNNVPSTRKSRRLQEKDGTRSAVEDVVEEIIHRGPGRPSRRATRSSAPLLSAPPVVESTRKSPRRKQACAPSSLDRSPTPQPVPSPQPASVPSHPTTVPSQPASVPSHPPSVPSQPASVPSQPASVSSLPASAPSQPALVVPSQPALVVPSQPALTPSQPASVPSQPASVPSQPASVPSQPASVPSQPASVPSQPASVPSQPASVPSQPASVPSQPVASPQPATSPSGKTLQQRDKTPQPQTPQEQQSLPVQREPPPPQKKQELQMQISNQQLKQSQSVVQPKLDREVIQTPIKTQIEAQTHQKDVIVHQRDLPVHSVREQHAQSLQQKLQPLTKQTPLIQHQQAIKLPPKLQSSLLNKTDLKNMLPHRPGEPTTLIDPVTGLLIPMREGEEGQYIPVGGDGEQPPEKRPRLDDSVTKAPVATVRPSVVRPPQQTPHSIPKAASPPHQPQKPVVNCAVPRPPKAHLLQVVTPERTKIQIPPPRPKLIPPQTQPIQAPKPPTPLTPKAHILQAIGNARETIIGSPAPHQGSILTGSVASPPLRAHPQPIVTGASSARFVMKNHPEPREGGCIVVPSPSPQPPPRGQVMQAGLPVPAYEASLHGVVAELLPNPQWPSDTGPPPAHQNSNKPKGEVVQHVNYPGHPHHIQPHYVHTHQLMYQQYLREAAISSSPYHRPPVGMKDVDDVGSSPPLELRRRASPHDRTTDSPQVATLYGRSHVFGPHRTGVPQGAIATNTPGRQQVPTPPHASQVPPQADSLLVLLQRYPVMWQGLLALKNDQAAVQMHFVFGNPIVARDSLPCNSDGSTPPLRIAQRMRLEQTQLDGVARKMQMENEHCMLLALPCGRDHMDVLMQSNNLQSGFITYLQQKQAAGIINIAAPGSQQAAFVVHIFPASDFANESLARIAPDLLHRVTDIAHLLIVIATV